MRSSVAIPTMVVIAALVAACGSPDASATPSTTIALAIPSFTILPTAQPSATEPAADPTPAASRAPAVPTAHLPIQGSARDLSADAVQLAAGSNGDLFVSIPNRDGPAVIARLGLDGKPMPGWPVAITTATSCDRPYPTGDGGVRIVCNATDLPLPELDARDVRGFAFDAGGHVMDGWPVRLRPGPSGYDPELGLTVLELRMLTDTVEDGKISKEALVTTVNDAGAVLHGTPVSLVEMCCGDLWTTGADGTSAGVRPVERGGTPMVAITQTGTLPGWPLEVSGSPSKPAFLPHGGMAVTVASPADGTSRVMAFDRAGHSRSSESFGLVTAEREGDMGGCSHTVPLAPVGSSDGSTIVYSQLTPSVIALDPSLRVRPGWPIRLPSPIQVPTPGTEEEHEAGYCPAPAPPAAGPDGTLYVPLVPASSNAGGSLVAVGTNGRIRSGWPVGLKRPGGEFWAVETGLDGTVYALAVEPETRGRSSATILAIEPDSTIRYATTIVEP